MDSSVKIVGRVLDTVNYISFQGQEAAHDLALLETQLKQWKSLGVEMHVLDMSEIRKVPDKFFVLIQGFALGIGRARLVSINMNEEFFSEVKRRKLESTFNRVTSLDDISEKKQIDETELRRLLVRYLIRAAYSAVEVALNSTVSCDENYLAKLEKVPFDQFDLVSIIDVRTDFLSAQFRLCASSAVLRKLASAMLGPSTHIDSAMIESMAMELLNLIYGKAKSNLNDKESFRLPPALPRLLHRDQFSQIKRSGSSQLLSILPLVTPMGAFYVEIDYGTFAESGRHAV